MGDRTPRRKASIASSASSGATIKPSNRQNSGSGSNGGFFARFRSSSQSRSDEDEDGDEGNGTDSEAGPSDYYRRSPSPSVNWGPEKDESSGSAAEMKDSYEDHSGWGDSVSDAPTPDADDSMSMDMLQYQRRLRDVLNGAREDTPEQIEGDVDEYPEHIEEDEVGDRLLDNTGIGEEEFGMPSPRSSPPSTPLKDSRRVSYIREFVPTLSTCLIARSLHFSTAFTWPRPLFCHSSASLSLSQQLFPHIRNFSSFSSSSNQYSRNRLPPLTSHGSQLW
jgi:hypothetical protein